jgi:hypothetical protein
MARDTMKGERNKQPAKKGRMNQGGASMPGKASARAQSLGMEKDTRAKTGGGPNRGRREEAGRLTAGAPAARRATQKSGAKSAGKASGRKAPASARRRSQ